MAKNGVFCIFASHLYYNRIFLTLDCKKMAISAKILLTPDHHSKCLRHTARVTRLGEFSPNR
jgi:hypothetical protein